MLNSKNRPTFTALLICLASNSAGLSSISTHSVLKFPLSSLDNSFPRSCQTKVLWTFRVKMKDPGNILLAKPGSRPSSLEKHAPIPDEEEEEEFLNPRSFSLWELTCMHCVYLALWTRKVLCGSFLCAIYKFSFIHSFIQSHPCRQFWCLAPSWLWCLAPALSVVTLDHG